MGWSLLGLAWFVAWGVSTIVAGRIGRRKGFRVAGYVCGFIFPVIGILFVLMFDDKSKLQ